MIFSILFLCMVMVQLRVKPCDRCRAYVLQNQPLQSETDTDEDRSQRSRISCACNTCGVCLAIMACISFLSQIMGCFIYAASSPIPSYTDADPHIAYWCPSGMFGRDAVPALHVWNSCFHPRRAFFLGPLDWGYRQS